MSQVNSGLKGAFSIIKGSNVGMLPTSSPGSSLFRHFESREDPGNEVGMLLVRPRVGHRPRSVQRRILGLHEPGLGKGWFDRA